MGIKMLISEHVHVCILWMVLVVGMEIEISARLYLQVGFNSGTANGLYYQMVDSQTDAIQHIVNGSNIGVPGEWLFSVGVLSNSISVTRPCKLGQV